MREVSAVLLAMVGAVLGAFVAAGPFVAYRPESALTAAVVLGPLGAIAGLFAGLKLGFIKWGEATRRATALARRRATALVPAVITVWLTPSAIVLVDWMIVRPNEFAVIAAILALIPASPAAIILPAIWKWRRAQSWRDSLIYAGVSAATLVLSASLLGRMFLNPDGLPWTGLAFLATYGATAGFLFFAAVRVFRGGD
jgi:hypothetical protein